MLTHRWLAGAALLALFACPVRAGVTGNTYHATYSSSQPSMNGCVEFAPDGDLYVVFAPAAGGVQFGGEYTELDLLFFGFWSFHADGVMSPSGSGVQLFFGLVIVAFGDDGLGSPISISGVRGECSTLAGGRRMAPAPADVGHVAGTRPTPTWPYDALAEVRGEGRRRARVRRAVTRR
jgi:hypothetical protein